MLNCNYNNGKNQFLNNYLATTTLDSGCYELRVVLHCNDDKRDPRHPNK